MVVSTAACEIPKTRWPKALLGTQRRGWIVIHDHHVAHAARAEFAQRQIEGARCNLRVVGEQRRDDLGEANRRVLGAEMLGPKRHAQLLQHVRGHGIRAQAHQDAPLHQREDVCNAHRVVQVRLRIVHHCGLRLGQEVHFPAIHMHAMRGDALWTEDAELA